MTAPSPGNRENIGYLYPNQKQNDRQPDYKGRLNVAGEDLWLSGWMKDGGGPISVAATDPKSLPPRGQKAPPGTGEVGRGELSANNKTNDRQPDLTGTVKVRGKDWSLAGWFKDKDGERMVSLRAQDPSAPRRAPAAAQENAPPAPAPATSPAPAAGASVPDGFGDIFDDLPG